MNTQMREFLCPSGPRGSAESTTKSAGITNYKAMGASTRDSLKMVVVPQAKPPYGIMSPPPAPRRCIPTARSFPAKARGRRHPDGLSHTIFTIETIDEAASRWTVGKEATLVGLPQKSSPTGTKPQVPYNFFAPPGFDNTFGADSAVAKAGLRTFLSYEFSPKGADAGKYEDPGFSRRRRPTARHRCIPAVVICGMGDGSSPSALQADRCSEPVLPDHEEQRRPVPHSREVQVPRKDPLCSPSWAALRLMNGWAVGPEVFLRLAPLSPVLTFPASPPIYAHQCILVKPLSSGGVL